jgi:tight adherence protein B
MQMESSQVITIAAALFVFVSVALVYVGVQSSRARASSPEMEDRLDRYGNVAEAAVTETSGSSATSMVSERIERAAKGTTFGETTATALARADVKMTVGEFIAIRGATAVTGFVVGMLIGRAQIGLAVLFGIGVAIVGWIITPI